MKRMKVVLSFFLLVGLAVGLQYENGALRRFKSVLRECARGPTPGSVFAAALESGSVLWSANMETGGQDLSQWYSPTSCASGTEGGGVFNTGTASASPSFDVAHGGDYSAVLRINTATESGTRLFRWQEPQTNSDLYYSVWYYFPQVYTPTLYWNVLQWISSNGVQRAPFFILGVDNQSGPSGPMYFYLYNSQTSTSYPQSPPGWSIPIGQWTHVEAHYVCSGSADGRVTIWQDGVQILDVAGVQTKYPDGSCGWSVNNYSNGLCPSPATIYVDDVAICSGGRCP